LKELSKEIFFALGRSLLFEKRLKSVLRMQFLSAARARNASQSCREVARLISEVNSEKTQEAEEDNFQEDNFPASTFKRLSK